MTTDEGDAHHVSGARPVTYGLNFNKTVLNVAIDGGRGPVPAPEDNSRWAPFMQRGVVDVATGRGLMPHFHEDSYR